MQFADRVRFREEAGGGLLGGSKWQKGNSLCLGSVKFGVPMALPSCYLILGFWGWSGT